MNTQEQPQPKRSSVGIRVMLVMGGILLLLGGLSAAYYSIIWSSEGDPDTAGFAAIGHSVSTGLVVFPLFAIGGILFLIGLRGLAKQMLRRSSILLTSLVVLAIGLPILGSGLAQLPLFVGPYPLFTYTTGGIGGGLSYYDHLVAWSPDGTRLASAGSSDGTVQVWDATDGQHVYTYRGHSLPVRAVAWSPDSKRIASGSSDQTVQVWDATDGQHVYTYRGHSAPVNMVAWSPDGTRIASMGDDGTVQVWDAADGSNEHTYGGPVSMAGGGTFTASLIAIAWSPDGTRIASGDAAGTVVVRDAISGTVLFTYPHSGVTVMAWSPDGKRIASGNFLDQTVQVWDAATGATMLTYRRHVGRLTAVAWSPDGKRIASANAAGTVQVWDAS